MTPATTAEAVSTLVAARKARKLLPPLPPAIAPGTIAEGYRLQDAFMATWVGKVAGWKIGATAKPIMDKFKLTEPFAGPFFAADVMASPAKPLAAEHPHLCLEAEFAFRFSKPLMPKATPYARDEVLDAVGAVIPAYELVGPRFERILFDGVPTVIGDCGLNDAMVLGQDVPDWRRFDLKSHPVRFLVDGKLRVEGSGAAVMGDPLKVLEWAANHFSARGITLEAGQIVSTGAAAGLMYVEPGETGVADFGPLGQVEITFTGPRSTETVKR